MNNMMWLSGGWNPLVSVFPNKTTNEVWLSLDGTDWVNVRENTYIDFGTFDSTKDWAGRHQHGFASFDGSIWIVGGDALSGRDQNDIWRSEDGINWRLVSERAPWADRSTQNVIVFDDYIWVLGGQTLPQLTGLDAVFYNDVWRSSDGALWEELNARGPMWSPRGLAGVVVFKDRLWVIGGGNYNTPASSRTYSNDVWTSANGSEWELVLGRAPWSPRFYHNVVAFDDYLWVFGGSTVGSQNLGDIWISKNGRVWTECESPIAPRHSASAVVADDGIYIMMGAGEDVMHDVWKISRL